MPNAWVDGWVPNAGVVCWGLPNKLFWAPKTFEVPVFPNPIYFILLLIHVFIFKYNRSKKNFNSCLN